MMTFAHEGGTRFRDVLTKRTPLVSIIVVVFRDRSELFELIQSLTPFRQGDLEVIVIDGGSDDGSLEVLEQFDNSIDYWRSEKDSGVYEAMNKGLAHAQGQWILHINAGDRLLSIPFKHLRSLDDSYDILCCRVQCEDLLFIPRTNWTSKFQNTWQHQGTFYRLANHDGYDTTYRIVGDYAANQRMIKQGKRAAISEAVVASHQNGGLSDGKASKAELDRSVRENFGFVHHTVNQLLFQPAKKFYYKLVAVQKALKR